MALPSIQELKAQSKSKLPSVNDLKMQKKGFSFTRGIEGAKKALLSGGKAAIDPAIGALKGVASTVSGASELGQRGLQALTPSFGKEDKITKIPEKYTKPEGLGQKAGFAVEQFGEFVAPTTAILKGRKAIQGAKAISKLPKSAQSLAKLAGISGLEAAGFGGVTALQEGELNKSVGTSAAIGAAFPIAGAGYQKMIKPLLKQKIPAKLMNSLIKPPSKEFSFGKNPGLAVAKEGIKANSIESLEKGIIAKKKEIGQKIGSVISKATKSGKVKPVNVTDDIYSVINKHVRNQTDDAVITRFNNTLDQLLNLKQPIMEKGKIGLKNIGERNISQMNPEELFRLTKKVGKLTQWTGAPADKPVNKMLAELYGVLSKKLDKMTGVKALQSRYANLLGAEKSIANRINVVNRADAIGLKNILGGGVIGGLTGDTPGDRVINAFIGGVLGKAAGSTFVKSRVASGLAKEGTGALAQRFVGAKAKDIAKQAKNVADDIPRLTSPRLGR